MKSEKPWQKDTAELIVGWRRQICGLRAAGHSELRFYLSLFNMQLPIESQYVATIADNLNAEIVLGTVTNLQEAATWLGYTYLYVRMLMNPSVRPHPLLFLLQALAGPKERHAASGAFEHLSASALRIVEGPA